MPTYLAFVTSITAMASIASMSTSFSGTHIEPVISRPEHRRLEAFLLLLAERLQHVKATKGERCLICHNLEPVRPVRLSCQHLFCCTCAYTTFVRHDTCPLCHPQPSPTKIAIQNPDIINDMDGRLKEIYAYYLPQLVSASHIAILAACWEMENVGRTFRCLYVLNK